MYPLFDALVGSLKIMFLKTTLMAWRKCTLFNVKQAEKRIKTGFASRKEDKRGPVYAWKDYRYFFFFLYVFS